MSRLRYRELREDKSLSGDQIYSLLCIQDLKEGYIKIMNMSDIEVKHQAKFYKKKKKHYTDRTWLESDLEQQLIRNYGERIFGKAMYMFGAFFEKQDKLKIINI